MTHRWIPVWTPLRIIRRHGPRWAPGGRRAVARRRLIIAVWVAVRWRTAGLQQRIERGRGPWRLRHSLAREKARLLRWRPRLAGETRPRRIVRIRAFRITIMAVLVRHWPFSGSVVTGRLATVTRLPWIGRHRRFALCVHDAIGRNAPDGLVGPVL